VSWRTRLRRSLPYAIAVIGGFLVAYVIVAFLIFPSGLIPKDIRVPNVTGMGFDDAVKRLAERGLRGMRGEERFHAASPKGTVLEQAPTAGSRDVEGATVTLTVSGGQQYGKIPNIVGMTQEQAATALDDAGFDVGDIVQQPSARPAGQVVETRPPVGTDAPMPGAVGLVISTGPPAGGRGGR
jgi:serine/threonine-protein kinase